VRPLTPLVMSLAALTVATIVLVLRIGLRVDLLFPLSLSLFGSLFGAFSFLGVFFLSSFIIFLASSKVWVIVLVLLIAVFFLAAPLDGLLLVLLLDEVFLVLLVDLLLDLELDSGAFLDDFLAAAFFEFVDVVEALSLLSVDLSSDLSVDLEADLLPRDGSSLPMYFFPSLAVTCMVLRRLGFATFFGYDLLCGTFGWRNC